MHGSVTLYVEAPPEAVWGLVTDVTRIGQFSPETFEAHWEDTGSGPVVGARFRGHVKRNGRWPKYWTKCKVVSSIPGREFGFSVMVGGRPATTWTYRLDPRGSGTDVTESFRLADNLGNRLYWRLAGAARGRTNADGMRQTLERMKVAAESAHGE